MSKAAALSSSNRPVSIEGNLFDRLTRELESAPWDPVLLGGLLH